MNIPVWLVWTVIGGLAWLALVFEFCLFIGRISQNSDVVEETADEPVMARHEEGES